MLWKVLNINKTEKEGMNLYKTGMMVYCWASDSSLLGLIRYYNNSVLKLSFIL